MNPFLRQPSAFQRTPLRAERPEGKPGAPGVVALRLYDPIDSFGGEWGVSAKEFAAVVDALPDGTEQIRLLINSPGGEVWEGIAILNVLRAHPAKVTAVVEGIAASSASFIAAGVDELEMVKNAEIYVHKAWGMFVGNTDDLQKFTDDLAHEDRNLASIYAEKAGGTVEDWLTAMAGEPTYSAQEAVQVGLADRVVDPKDGAGDAAAQAKARFDLRPLARADRRRVLAVKTPAPQAPGTEEGASMSLAKYREALAGLPDGASEEDIRGALASAGLPTSQPPAPADPPQPPNPSDPPPTNPSPDDPELPSKQALASGRVKIVDAAVWDAMQDQARKVDQLVAERQREKRDQVIADAMRAGKFGPGEKEHYEALWNAAPQEAEKVIGLLTPGRIPVNAAGYVAGIDSDDAAEDAMFDSLFPPEMRLSGQGAASRG